MNFPIISSGVVCPGGMGEGALQETWHVARTRGAGGVAEYDTMLVDRNAPALKRWQKEPRLRRASPISYYLVEAADQALSAVPHVDRAKTGVVGSLFLGCLVYSVKFYRQLNDDGRRFASPLLFPETVFNSPLSHMASVLGLGGPVYSQVGDTSCWGTALRTAQCWLTRGRVDHVLVLGAEEFEPHELDAFQAAGLFRQRPAVAEGAGAMLLSRGGRGCGVELAAVADGHVFHSREGAKAAAIQCLKELPEDCPVLKTATGWTEKVEEYALHDRTTVDEALPNPSIAGTASCAWNTILAANILRRTDQLCGLVIPYFGLSQQCAAAHLTRTEANPAGLPGRAFMTP